MNFYIPDLIGQYIRIDKRLFKKMRENSLGDNSHLFKALDEDPDSVVKAKITRVHVEEGKNGSWHSIRSIRYEMILKTKDGTYGEGWGFNMDELLFLVMSGAIPFRTFEELEKLDPKHFKIGDTK